MDSKQKTTRCSKRDGISFEKSKSLGGLIFLIPANILLLFIFLYQKTLSPFIGQSCRFSPSCSNYAIEAIKTHGTIIGFLLSVWRILRCNPFCKSGYDPVPTLIKNQNKNIN